MQSFGFFSETPFSQGFPGTPHHPTSPPTPTTTSILPSPVSRHLSPTWNIFPGLKPLQPAPGSVQEVTWDWPSKPPEPAHQCPGPSPRQAVQCCSKTRKGQLGRILSPPPPTLAITPTEPRAPGRVEVETQGPWLLVRVRLCPTGAQRVWDESRAALLPDRPPKPRAAVPAVGGRRHLRRPGQQQWEGDHRACWQGWAAWGGGWQQKLPEGPFQNDGSPQHKLSPSTLSVAWLWGAGWPLASLLHPPRLGLCCPLTPRKAHDRLEATPLVMTPCRMHPGPPLQTLLWGWKKGVLAPPPAQLLQRG